MTSSCSPSDDPESKERELVLRVVVDDDHVAFEQLVKLYQSPVRHFLRRLTGQDLERADDLAQETFFKAYRYLSSYRGDGKLRSWLFSVAYQLFVSDERRSKKMRFDALGFEPIATRIQGEEFVLSHTVHSMLQGLREEERAAILLCYQHDLTHQEAASTLGVPLGAVKSLVRRGREKMKALYTSAKARRN